MKRIALMIVMMAFALTATGCLGPAKLPRYVEVDSNETAFVVPMEGDTESQGKFESVAFLESKKVASKRIYLPLKKIKTGRMWFDYKWEPTVRVIKVDRSPITMTWEDKDGIQVESKDSIGFNVGVNISAYVLEEDTAKFLYKYPSANMSHVVSSFIKSSATEILSREFAKYTLDEGRVKKGEIVGIAKIELQKKFKDFGITINTFGLVGGLTYENPAIQTAIDKNFITEREKQNATNLADAETEKARGKVMKAKGEKEAAIEFAKAEEARKKQAEVDIRMMEAEARLAWAKNWNGQLPASILPSDSPLMINVK